MTLHVLRLTLNGSQQYDVTMIDEVRVRSSKEAFSISPPGLAASENILLGISGMQADITIRFNIHNDGSDKANGTHSSSVVTLDEQTNYLEDVMHAPDFDASWTLSHVQGGSAFSGDDVFLERFETPVINQSSPKWLEARLELRRGQSLG